MRAFFYLITKYAFLFFVSCCVITYAYAANESDASNSTDAFVKHIRMQGRATPVLVEALGFCEPHSEIIQLPPVNWSDISYNKKAEASRNEYLRVDGKAVSVKMVNGVLTYKWPNISDQILNLNINHIDLNKEQRYSVGELLDYLLSKKEVRDAMHQLRMRPMVQLSGVTPQPSFGQPHLDELINNRSLVDMLNLILHHFKGILFYKECTLPDGQKRMDFNYYAPSPSGMR